MNMIPGFHEPLMASSTAPLNSAINSNVQNTYQTIHPLSHNNGYPQNSFQPMLPQIDFDYNKNPNNQFVVQNSPRPQQTSPNWVPQNYQDYQTFQNYKLQQNENRKEPYSAMIPANSNLYPNTRIKSEPPKIQKQFDLGWSNSPAISALALLAFLFFLSLMQNSLATNRTLLRMGNLNRNRNGGNGGAVINGRIISDIDLEDKLSARAGKDRRKRSIPKSIKITSASIQTHPAQNIYTDKRGSNSRSPYPFFKQ